MRNLSTLVLNSRCEHTLTNKLDGTARPHDDHMNRLNVWSFRYILQQLLRLSALDNPASPLTILDFSNFSDLKDDMLSLEPDSRDLEKITTTNEVETDASKRYFFGRNLRALDASATSVT